MALALRLPQFIVAIVGVSTGLSQLQREALAADSDPKGRLSQPPNVGPAAPSRPMPEWAPAPAPVLPPVVPPSTAAPPAYYPTPSPSPTVAPAYPGYPPTTVSPYQAQPYPMPPRPATLGPGARQSGAGGTAPPCAAKAAVAPEQNALASWQRGFLLLPYAGVQFPGSAADWFSNGYRLGSLFGGRLTENISLSAELGFTFWGWQGTEGGDTHHAGQVDISATLLRHFGTSFGELVLGPRFGRALIFRNDSEDDPRIFVNGWLMGAKFGLFWPVKGEMALGGLVDLTYIVNPVQTDANCFYYENDYDCARAARHTTLASVSAALLF